MTAQPENDGLTLGDIVREFCWEAWQGGGRYYARRAGRPRAHSYTVSAGTIPGLRREILAWKMINEDMHGVLRHLPAAGPDDPCAPR